MKIAWLLAVVALCATGDQQTPARDAVGAPVIGTARLSGVVVTDEEQPHPVRRAIVTLAGGELRASRGAITDDEGRFSFDRLPAGRFVVTVARASFVTSVYGAKRPGRPGTPVVVAEGQHVSNLTVRLWRGAAVAGTVRDEMGAPVEGIPVSVISARAIAAEGIFTLTNNGATTDDRGEYRIFGLEPGTYVVSAKPASAGGGPLTAMSEAEVDLALDWVKRRAAVAAGAPAPAPAPALTASRPFAYAPIFFPGTARIAEASAIALAAGQEMTGVDIALVRVPTTTISGIVVRPDGQPARGASLMLTAVAVSTAFRAELPAKITSLTRADGRFEISQVTPGDYQLVVRDPVQAAAPVQGMVTPGSAGPSLWAQLDLSVSTNDLSGISITVEPGVTLTGRVSFSAGTLKPPTDLSRWNVSLIPSEMLGRSSWSSSDTLLYNRPATLRPDGSFEMAGIAPGRYLLSVNGPDFGPTGWIARSATLAGGDMLDAAVEISSALPDTTIGVTVSDRHTELSGNLQTPAGQPVSDVFVIAFSADQRSWGPNWRRVKAVRPGVDGHFSIADLPAGDYLLAALADIEMNDWQDAAFLSRLPTSVKVSIGDGEKKMQDLRIGG